MSETVETSLLNRIGGTLPDWLEPPVRAQIMAGIATVLPGARGIGDNMPPEPIEGESEEDYLRRIDPTHLVVVATERLAPLFDVHYPKLKARGAEWLERARKWQTDHKDDLGRMIDVRDDVENAELSELIIHLDAYDKEVEEARKAVKAAVFDAGRVIDGWFKGELSEPVMEIRGVTQRAGGRSIAPGPGTMQFAQTKYLNDKVTRERQEREKAARLAEEEANRRAAEAREVAAQEAARAAELEQAGLSPEEAADTAAVEVVHAQNDAELAMETSALIGNAAAAPATEIAKQRTATGTTGLAGRWKFEIASMRALCGAVAGLPSAETVAGWRAIVERVIPRTRPDTPSNADLVALSSAMAGWPRAGMPENFVQPQDKTINAAITARVSPLRDCPGLTIYQEHSARRTGVRA